MRAKCIFDDNAGRMIWYTSVVNWTIKHSSYRVTFSHISNQFNENNDTHAHNSENASNVQNKRGRISHSSLECWARSTSTPMRLNKRVYHFKSEICMHVQFPINSNIFFFFLH